MNGVFTPTWPARVVRRGQRGSGEPVAVLWCERDRHQLAQVFLFPGPHGHARAVGFVREPADRGTYRTVALELGGGATPPDESRAHASACPCTRRLSVLVPHRLLWQLVNEQVARDPDGQGHDNVRRASRPR